MPSLPFGSKDDLGNIFWKNIHLVGWQFGMMSTGSSSIFPKQSFRQVAIILFILFFKIILVQNSQRGMELNDSIPQIAVTTFAFSSVFILLLWEEQCFVGLSILLYILSAGSYTSPWCPPARRPTSIPSSRWSRSRIRPTRGAASCAPLAPGDAHARAHLKKTKDRKREEKTQPKYKVLVSKLKYKF